MITGPRMFRGLSASEILRVSFVRQYGPSPVLKRHPHRLLSVAPTFQVGRGAKGGKVHASKRGGK